MAEESAIAIGDVRIDVNDARRSVLLGGFADLQKLQNFWRRPLTKLVAIGQFWLL